MPVAVVTGGSRGIGKAVVTLLRNQNFKVLTISKTSIAEGTLFLYCATVICCIIAQSAQYTLDGEPNVEFGLP